MRAPDRSNVANRDGAHEGIGSIPEGDTSAPSQRYVVRVDLDGSHALGLISGDIYVGPEHKTYEATFITRDAWRAAEGDDAGSDLAPGPGRMFEGIAELQGWSPNTKIRLRLFVPDDQAQPLRLELKRRFLLAEFARTYPIYRADLHPVGGVHPYLRLIDLSVVYQPGVPRLGVFQAEYPPAETNTAAKRQTVERAFGDAGILIRIVNPAVRLAAAAVDRLNGPDEPNGRWNDEELHAAMEEIGGGGGAADGQATLLVVSRHVNGALAGLMFDSMTGLPRQGAAVFVSRLDEVGGDKVDRRDQGLHTVVHEIGHMLNLLHCFQADRSELYRGRARPESLSWMNYPHLYPNGDAQPDVQQLYDEARQSYWRRFGFSFDRDELMHLRHGGLHDVIIGGRIEAFMRGPTEAQLLAPSAPAGLELDLVLPDEVEFMQQVEGYVRLYNRSATKRRIHQDLSPSAGRLAIAVCRHGLTRAFRHYSSSCVPLTSLGTLEPGEKAYEPLTVSFGDRWYIDLPGNYDIQAVYYPPDGSAAVSPVRRVIVKRPWDADAERYAADFFSHGVGLYLGLEGSRSRQLAKVDGCLQEAAERFNGRAIASQIRRAGHLMWTRPFKRLDRSLLFDEKRAADAAQALYDHYASACKSDALPKAFNLRSTRHMLSAYAAFERTGSEGRAQETRQLVLAYLRSIEAPSESMRKVKRAFDERSLKSKHPA